MEIRPEIFRVYDIRGVVGEDLTADVARSIGQALGTIYPQHGCVVIGRDGRLSSPLLAEALSAGLMATGRTVIDIGEVPTPVLYYATHALDTRAGVMITGSHNPPEYNGIKLVMGGRTLFGEAIQAIYHCICEGQFASGKGRREIQDLSEDYIQRIADDIRLVRPMRIALDCGNGAAGPVASRLLRSLGCELLELYTDVDGRFPNHHPNPSDPENLRDLARCVTDNKLALGLAFDGDGDRLGVIDDRGHIIWPDRLMMLLAADVLSGHPGATIIFDVKSSRHLKDWIAQKGGQPLMWKTGHSLLKAKMNETGALLAGEMSGHICLGDRWYRFDDALYAAARLIQILSQRSESSSEVFAELPGGYSTPEMLIHFDKEGAQHAFMREFLRRADFADGRQTRIDGLRVEYDQGWGLLRASNTTPSLTVRLEGDTPQFLEQLKARFRKEIHTIAPDLVLPF